MHAEEQELARFATALDALHRTICDAGAPSAITADRRAWLASTGLAGADLDALAALDAPRLLLYRALVRDGLRAAIRVEIPRTAARLGGAFGQYVERFVDEQPPRSHYLRDVAFEFVAWARPRWAEDPTVLAFLADLASHELSSFEVACAEPGPGPSALPLELDRGARFDPSARVYRYAHAVHELCGDDAARDVPDARPTALLGYRDPEHEVRYLELTLLAAAILSRLLDGKTLRAAVLEGCAELGHAPEPSVLEGAGKLLEELEARGVLLGAEPASTMAPAGRPASP